MANSQKKKSTSLLREKWIPFNKNKLPLSLGECLALDSGRYPDFWSSVPIPSQAYAQW